MSLGLFDLLGLLHVLVNGSATASGRDPVDHLVRILDIAGLEVDTVGRVDLQGLGSMAAPDRMYAPTSARFSITAIMSSGFLCFRRIAQARPTGPAPTTMTSYSIISRWVIFHPLLQWFRMQALIPVL